MTGIHDYRLTVKKIMDSTFMVEDQHYFLNIMINPGNAPQKVDVLIPDMKLIFKYMPFSVGMQRETSLEDYSFHVVFFGDETEEELTKKFMGAMRGKTRLLKDMTLVPKFLNDLQKTYKNCQRCELSKVRDQLVFGEISSNFDQCDFLIIGEAPGKDENRQGTPFIGRSGKLLRNWLERAEINENYMITNTVCCYPGSDDTGKDKQPSKDSVKACKKRMYSLIMNLKPKYVICVGAVALKIVTGKSGISKMNCSKFYKLMKYENDLMFFKVVPIFHPSYILRNGTNKYDVEKIVNALSKLKGEI